jgi:hypothetical protein
MAFYKTQVHLSNFTFYDWEGDETLKEFGIVNDEFYYEIPTSFPLPTHDTEVLTEVTLTPELLTALIDNTTKSSIDLNFVYLSSITL